MIVFVSGGSTTVARFVTNPHIGQFVTPRSGNAIRGDIPWAADNGCFGGLDAPRFRAMLAGLPAGAVFITVPDVVADHAATRALWNEWRDEVAAVGPPAFVLQDGCREIPSDAGAVFIGGSTAYKLGGDVRVLVAEAKRRRLWIHMGRVNSRRRILYAAAIGADSFDGTSASMFPDIYIPRLLRWAEEATRQGALFTC